MPVVFCEKMLLFALDLISSVFDRFDMAEPEIWRKMCGRAGCDQYSVSNQLKLWSLEGNVTRLASTGAQSWIDDYVSYMTTAGCCNYDNVTLKPCPSQQSSSALTAMMHEGNLR